MDDTVGSLLPSSSLSRHWKFVENVRLITAVHEEGPFHIHQQEKFIKEIKSSKRKTQKPHKLDFNKHLKKKKTKPVNMF